MLDWRQIWGSGGQGRVVAVWRQTCDTLASSFFVYCTTPNFGVDVWASRATHLMGAAIPNLLQPCAFEWFEKTQGSLMKVLSVPGWRPMAVPVHFLRCGDLLDDWSVEGILSLVFV
ncbi:uncharacterized protein TNCV_242211 [Trichonephila clavipes]|uniref:Uncharacterized protein n=1 Tax=Trichonephila clavipes TaxID=2585209 RepID=A0A8X6W3S2_TRICX|nr:uncharacterized protein TNCV_242211 [Trichonephila clavipes]